MCLSIASASVSQRRCGEGVEFWSRGKGDLKNYQRKQNRYQNEPRDFPKDLLRNSIEFWYQTENKGLYHFRSQVGPTYIKRTSSNPSANRVRKRLDIYGKSILDAAQINGKANHECMPNFVPKKGREGINESVFPQILKPRKSCSRLRVVHTSTKWTNRRTS